MKKLILGIIFSIALIFILFSIKEKLSQAQNFGIELYVYPQGFYGPPPIRILDAPPNNIYKIKRNSAVVGNTEYKLLLKGVGTATFTLTFFKLSHSIGGPIPLGAREYSGNCSDFRGKLINNDCEIIGTFQEPTSSINWELWRIQLRQGEDKNAHLSFYLVRRDYAQTTTISSKNDQYYLEPTSTTTEPTSTITYKVYSNKLYCPNYMASGQSTAIPTPSSGSFVHFNVASTSFVDNDFVSATLGLRGVASGTYELYLVNNLNQRISTPTPVRITVRLPFTPPPGSFECPGASGNWCRCVLSYCYWLNPSTNSWEPTSSSACGDVCVGGVRE